MARKALAGLEGVEDVSVNFADKTASVKFEKGKVNTEAMIKALQKVGYDGSVISQ